MLSTTSGFTQDQAQRFRAMFQMLLAGIVVMILGVGILCFGRMYTFDSSRYDLFTVFGVIIVVIASVTIVVPVYCQLRIYQQVRRDAKGETGASGSYGPGVGYAPVLHPGMSAQPQGMTTAPYGTSVYQQHQQQQLPFSSATYMMGKQQQQQPMAQRMDADPRLFNASLASDESMRHQGRSPIWSSTGKQQPI